MRTHLFRFYSYLKKDFLLLYKRKKYLYTFMLLPLIIAILFLFALNPGDYVIEVGVCDFDGSTVSQAAYENLQGFSPTILEGNSCLEELVERIQRGELDLGLEIGKGFESNLENLEQAKLVVYYDNTDIAFSNLVYWKVDQSLEPFKSEVIRTLNEELSRNAGISREGIDILFELTDLPARIDRRIERVDEGLEKVEGLQTEFIVNPVWTEKRPIYAEDNLKKDAGIVYIFPILALLVMLMLASTSIIYDKHNHFITRVKSTASLFSYVLAKTLFFTLLVVAQFVIVLLIFMMYGGRYAIAPLSLFELLLFVGIVDGLLGLLIGLITNNEGIAVLFSLMVSFPLMLISGVFFPTQALPKVVQWLGSVLPLEYQINYAKSVLLFGQTMTHTWWWFAALLFISVIYVIRKN